MTAALQSGAKGDGDADTAEGLRADGQPSVGELRDHGPHADRLGDVRVLWVFHVFILRISNLAGIWVILIWFAWDVLMLYLGAGGVGYWCHVGGFAAGFLIAMLLAVTGWVKPVEDEQTLLEVFGLGRGLGEG